MELKLLSAVTSTQPLTFCCDINVRLWHLAALGDAQCQLRAVSSTGALQPYRQRSLLLNDSPMCGLGIN